MKYYKSIIALILMVACATSVGAQSTTTRGTTSQDVRLKMDRQEVKRMEVRQKVQELKARASSTVDKRCNNLTDRIDKRLSHFGAMHDRHLKVYEMHKEKLAQIEEKLSGEGIDTATLKANLSVLDSKLEKFTNDRAKVQAALQNTKNFTCGESEGQFKSAVQAVRDAQRVVAADAKDIHEFIQITLKRNIVELRTTYNTKKGQN